MSINKCFLIGRLTKDVELRYTTSNIAVASFTLAINRPMQKDKEQVADFINIIVWRTPAENAKKYLSKGSQVAIDGRIQTRNYDDEQGKKVYVTEVVADNIQFLDSKKKEETTEKTNSEVLKDAMENPYESFAQDITDDESSLPF